MPELGPQTYATVNAFVERTADLDPEVRSGAVQPRGRGGGGRRQAGRRRSSAPDSSKPTPGRSRWRPAAGLFAYHRTTDADFSVTARTPDGTGSGWATRRRARLGRGGSGGDRPHRRAEGGGQPQSAGDRAGPLHRGARAAGGERSGAAARRRAQRAQRRRRAQPVLEARRRHAHRREGDGRARDAVLGSRRSGAARPAVRQRGPAAVAAWSGSRRASCGTCRTRGSGRRSRARSRPAPPFAGGLALDRRHEEHRGADRRLRARHPRHALLLHPLARRRAPCCRPA